MSPLLASRRAADERLVRLQAHDDGLNRWDMAQIAPPPALRGLVRGYADYAERTGGFTRRRELPHAEGVLIINLDDPIAVTGGDGTRVRLAAGEVFVAGVHLGPALSESGGAQAGIHVFLPLETLRRLLGVPMVRLLDRVVPLDALLGGEARALGARLADAPCRAARVRLLDQALTRRLSHAPPLAGAQAHALRLLRDQPRRDIAAIAAEIGWSRKHLAARVHDAIGVGPRSFRRLLRFQALTGAIGGSPGPPDWAGLAHEAGYRDQPHMIREFREFAGMTPGDYVARSLPAGGGLIEA